MLLTFAVTIFSKAFEMSCPHTRSFILREHFSYKHFLVSNEVSPILGTCILGSNIWNLDKKLLPVRPKHWRKGVQEVEDKLGNCVLNLLPEVSTLPSLLAISLMKEKIFSICHVASHSLYDQRVMWLPYCKSQPCLVRAHKSSASGDITYSICKTTSQYHLMWPQLLVVCHHPYKFGNYANWNSRDICF